MTRGRRQEGDRGCGVRLFYIQVWCIYILGFVLVPSDDWCVSDGGARRGSQRRVGSPGAPRLVLLRGTGVGQGERKRGRERGKDDGAKECGKEEEYD